MRVMRIFLFISILVFCHSNLQAQDNAPRYIPNTVILKVKTTHRTECDNTHINIPALNQYLQQLGAYTLVKKYSRINPPEKEFDKYGRKYADLSLIYELKYTTNLPIEKTITKLNSLGYFEYVQPHYIPHTCFTPNDTNYHMQYNVQQIRADSAWDVEQGDTNTVIGIIDTGTLLDHPDLKDNIKYNYKDTINHIDDDHDGYIDNFYGWDVGMNDNNPTWQGNQHGIHVCGIAAASVNNITGIAGIGYKCKFLPVKIADGTGTLVAGYEGITYAAQHGCSVINCSWGSNYGGPYGQDVITYATINMNALVVAAAGNAGLNELFYPACYQYVLNVAATDNYDIKASFSNYGYNIGVCAPGVNIYSTWDGNPYFYTSLSGTSMASPCAAGAVGIVKSHFPAYNAEQVAQRLIVTADNIDSKNSAYAGMLGGGRINLYRAVTVPVAHSVNMTYDSIVDNNNNIFITGDTLRIRGTFTNYLDTVANLNVTLSTVSPYITIANGSANLGALATMGTANNYNVPFTAKISSTSPINQNVLFELTFTDGSYISHQYFNVLINVDYLNIAINQVATTITSKGLIGYDGPNQSVGGLGFTYNGSNSLLYEGGLMIGTDSNHVSNYLRNSTTNDADFQSTENVHQLMPSIFSQFDLDGFFNDAVSSTILPVKVHHQAFAWDSPGNRKYVIVQYTIYNTGATTFNNMYAGIFADWDVVDSTYNKDRCSFDAPYRMGYAYYSGGGPYVGIAVLSQTAPALNYSIDNDGTGMGGINIYNGYATQQKYYTLTHSRNNAGVSGSGDDIVDVVSSGPFVVAPGDSARITFALIAGDSLKDLEASVDSANAKFNNILTAINELNNQSSLLLQNYPNPANQTTTISFRLPKKENTELSIYNLVGEKIMTIANTTLQSGVHEYNVPVSNLSAGIYYYRLNCESGTFVKKMMIIH
jgi:serine protease